MKSSWFKTTGNLLLHTVLWTSYSVGILTCKHTDPDLSNPLSADQLAIVQNLERTLAPIQDANPDRSFSDLVPLDSLLAKSQLVGLGEATHGTHEFAQLKDRLFRYLVQQHGCQAMAFEANFGRCVMINRFIHGQTNELGSAGAAAIYLGYEVWAIDEVRQLLQWLRDYNTGKPAAQQVSFYGIDCQPLPINGNQEQVLIDEFATKVGSLSAVKAQTNIQQVYNLFTANESKWVGMGGREDYEIAKQAARILVQQQDLGDPQACEHSAKREKYMAENVGWVRDRIHMDKVGIWAHNDHVSNRAASFCNQPSMGYYLKQQAKASYLIVGTSLSKGSLRANNKAVTSTPVAVFAVNTALVPTSFNYLLGQTESRNFILSLTSSKLDPLLKTWSQTPQPFFSVGSSYDERIPRSYYDVTTLGGNFDVLIHFRDTSASTLIN